MDDGQGRMRPMQSLDEVEALRKRYPNHGSVFSVGDVIRIKESLFRVSKIINNGLKLELLPNAPGETGAWNRY